MEKEKESKETNTFDDLVIRNGLQCFSVSIENVYYRKEKIDICFKEPTFSSSIFYLFCSKMFFKSQFLLGSYVRNICTGLSGFCLNIP